MSDTERTIAEAEGLAFLGLYVESWEAVETQPSSVRLFPEVLAVRLLICAGLPRFELGREIARIVGPGSAEGIREAAGRFRLADALALCAAGDMDGARAAVAAMAVVWPEGRALALDAPGLAGLW